MNKSVLLIICLVMAIDCGPCFSAIDDEVVGDPIFNKESIDRMLYDTNISGKILNKDGGLFTEEVIVSINTKIAEKWTENPAGPPTLISRSEKFEQKITGGYLSWKGKAARVSIGVDKKGFHGSYTEFGADQLTAKISCNDALFYLIPKGTPAKLEYVGGADIPSINSKQSSGKQCGWSFAKRWYFPVDEDVPVDIVLGTNDNKKRTYTMKEPGGFVYCPGLPAYGSRLNELYNDFNWMPEAPEDGYVQTVCPADNADKEKGDIYYYFKTPEGKYGKICFHGKFDYYINPDGSRNLEIDKFLYRPPLNPDIEHMPDDNEAYSPDEY